MKPSWEPNLGRAWWTNLSTGGAMSSHVVIYSFHCTGTQAQSKRHGPRFPTRASERGDEEIMAGAGAFLLACRSLLLEAHLPRPLACSGPRS